MGLAEEARAESVVTGTWRLKAGPDRWTVGTLREDGVVALEGAAFRRVAAGGHEAKGCKL
ncbi:MAG: hypothetical protein ACE5JO_07300 [Candidatus Binatia bacterium]